MRILQVIPVFSDQFGGPVSVVRSISKELAKRHEVVVYTTTALDPKHDSTPRDEERDGYRVVYFPRTLKQLCYSYFFGQLNLSVGLMRAVKEHLMEFDIIHVHSYQQFPDVLISQYATKYGVPYVLQPHGSIPKIGKKYRKMMYDVLFGCKVLRNASKVIALSRIEAQQQEALGVLREKIIIVPNSLDLEEYANLPVKGSFKRRFNVPENKKIILYLGRIHSTKGVDVLVKAFAFLTKDMHLKDVLLVIAGPDDGYLDEIKSLADSLGVSDSIVFTGFISGEDKIKALRDAEVFVTPFFYGFPMTFLEACAVGTPIITTTHGDTLEWIDSNVGYSVPSTYIDLGKAIYKIISNPELRERFSITCRRIMDSNFSVDRVVSKLEQIYEQIAADGL